MQHCKRSTMRAGTFTHEEKKVSDLWQDYCCTRKQNSEQQHESINNHFLETKSARKLVPSQYPWLAFFLLSWTSPLFFAWIYQWLQSICFIIPSASLDRSSHRQRSSGAFNRTYISHTQVAPSLAPAHNLHALIRPKYVPFGVYLVSKQQQSPMLHAFPSFNAAYWVLSHCKRHACYQHDTALVAGKLQVQSFQERKCKQDRWWSLFGDKICLKLFLEHWQCLCHQCDVPPILIILECMALVVRQSYSKEHRHKERGGLERNWRKTKLG